jgi:hypothetical protein
VQFVSIGLLGEILMRTYHESQEKPIFRVREIRDGRVAAVSDAVERLH